MVSKVVILACIATWNIVPSFSFHVGPSQYRLHSYTPVGKFTKPRLFEAASDAEETKGNTKLKFEGIINQSSNPLPLTSKDKLESFFQLSENGALLATAGGKRAWEEIELSSELLEEWKKVCDIAGSQYPDENDAVLSVQTGGVDFPGLHLKTVAKIGVKLIRDPDESNLRYEYSLLGDERTVSGLPPVVWIFNQLTGAGGEKDGKQESSTRSLSIVSYKETDDSKVIFTIDALLSVTVKFPAILLKILPTNKEKAEETGGKALTKAVEKDIADAMKAFEEAYLKSIN